MGGAAGARAMSANHGGRGAAQGGARRWCDEDFAPGSPLRRPDAAQTAGGSVRRGHDPGAREWRQQRHLQLASLLAIRPLPLAQRRVRSPGSSASIRRPEMRVRDVDPEFLDYRASLTWFSALGASVRETMTLTGRGDAERLETSRQRQIETVRGLKWRVVGRSGGSESPRAAREVILSHRFWINRLAEDPAIVGQTSCSTGSPRRLSACSRPTSRWQPLRSRHLGAPGVRSDGSRLERRLRVMGQLRPGVTVGRHGEADVARRSEHPTRTPAGRRGSPRPVKR